MKTIKLLLVGCLVMAICSSCKEKVPTTTRQVALEDYQAFGSKMLSINSTHIRSVIDSMIRNDKDGLSADFRTRSYYLREGNFLWINRHGVSSQADTLLSYLTTVEEMGFSPKRFCVPQIAKGIEMVRKLDFEQVGNINVALGRLEYQLTKAYLRYATGQRFGYMNPNYVFNRVDTLKPTKPDTIQRPVRFRGLFDIKMEHADGGFFEMAIRKIAHDSVPAFLREVQPKSDFLQALAHEYSLGEGNQNWRVKLLCNMERSRWRLADYPQQHKKYVLVNIPSFHLMAVDGEDTLSMRIGCGSYETKTPLLTSAIKRMDVNPNWIVPRSIIEKDMIHYFSRSYCERRGFFVMDRRTGKELDMNQVHRGLLQDPHYAVVQRGGKGNSLGRLIFRFDNNFSVYLHDTSSRDFFSREDRGVSHGCVRVEKPFELAKFMLKDKDEKLISDLDYCMNSDSLTDKSRILGSIKVEPQVPVYLCYFTIYPMRGHERKGWVEYPDVYGYDEVIYKYLVSNYK